MWTARTAYSHSSSIVSLQQQQQQQQQHVANEYSIFVLIAQ